MAEKTYETMTRQELEQRLKQEKPDNEDRKSGYALVNVLDPEAFEDEHIPNSINIPKKRIDAFQQRFDKSKEIVVYCASPECTASPDTARELARRGFVNVFDYEKGMSDWKEAGEPVAGRKAA